MSLTIDEVTVLSRRVAAEFDARLEVVAVVANDGEAGRTELLITIEGCHREPCSLMLNLPRGGRAEMEQALRTQLTETMHRHGRE